MERDSQWRNRLTQVRLEGSTLPMASGIDIYSQLLISTIRISDINNLHELVISLIRIIDISNCE